MLDTLRKNNGVSVMYVTPVSKGLVSTRAYHRNELVIYICGRVSLPRECHGREPGKILPFVTLYRFFLQYCSLDDYVHLYIGCFKVKCILLSNSNSS